MRRPNRHFAALWNVPRGPTLGMPATRRPDAFRTHRTRPRRAPRRPGRGPARALGAPARLTVPAVRWPGWEQDQELWPGPPELGPLERWRQLGPARGRAGAIRGTYVQQWRRHAALADGRPAIGEAPAWADELGLPVVQRAEPRVRERRAPALHIRVVAPARRNRSRDPPSRPTARVSAPSRASSV